MAGVHRRDRKNKPGDISIKDTGEIQTCSFGSRKNSKNEFLDLTKQNFWSHAEGRTKYNNTHFHFWITCGEALFSFMFSSISSITGQILWMGCKRLTC